MMSSFGRKLVAASVAAVLAGSTAGAQLLPPISIPPVSAPVGNVPVAGGVVQAVLQQLLDNPETRQVVYQPLNYVGGLPDRVAGSGQTTLLDLRRLRHREMIREHRRELEADERGQPVRRGVLIVANPDEISLRAAASAGFRVAADEQVAELGIRTVQLAVPRGMSARDALRQIRRVAPRLQADYDHVFEPAGGALMPLAGSLAAAQGQGGGRKIGIIDGGVASHPSLGSASIEQRGFAGSPQPTGHGTAVASLIVGSHGAFAGAARGSSLLVADVYGGNRAAGSANTIVRALGWLAAHRPGVINVSLVGPQNAVVGRAIQAVRARGIHVVAAVGNDGPAAPPQFPASYPGVIAITAVDANGRALPEAGRSAHLDFAAPGADMAAALPGQGYARVRGTSFAAPLVTARLAMVGSPQRLAAEARPGRGRVGKGIVCGDCRVPPRAVSAR